MADWEEIKRLAADFQRAQLGDSVQRLAEHNCIEIVQKLQQMNLISVIYTIDGKEYLTHQELAKEIREELQVHGGRISLVDLQEILKVDLKHIEARVQDIVKSNNKLKVVLGQIIDSDYLNGIAEEINDKLQAQGQTTIAELTKTYVLPADFLLSTIRARLRTIIEGKLDVDGDAIYTDEYVARQRSKICGAFSAITRPTSMMKILNQFCLQERLFFSILDELVGCKRLAGSITGGRQDTAQYVPDIYTKAQTDWVDSFYRQNGYLEYASLNRLGISDAKGYIRKRLKGESLVYLGTCAVGPAILDRVQAEVNEALDTCLWIDIQASLPSIFSEKDANQLLTAALKSKTGASVYCSTIVASQEFVSSLLETFKSQMQARADKEAKSSPVFLSPEGDKKISSRLAGLDDGSTGREDKKDQRKKKAAGSGKSCGGGGGAGSQGREVKTKSTKKKGGRGRADANDHGEDREAASSHHQKKEVEFLSLEEITEVLEKLDSLAESDEEFLTEIAAQLYRPLCHQYEEMLKSVFMQQTGAATSSDRRKTHTELAEKVTGLWSNVQLFEKGMKYFTDDTQVHLSRHLLRTVCTDITNLVFNAVATEHMMSVEEETSMTQEVRLRILTKIPDEKSKGVLTKLHASLNGKTLTDFYTHLESACSSDLVGIMLKKLDKKKERQLVINHRASLADQLEGVCEPALGLHLAATLLFTVHTQCLVHAPGRCVPQLLQVVKEYLPADQHTILIDCQESVIQHLKAQTEANNSTDNSQAEERAEKAEELAQQLQALLPKVKDIAVNARRSAAGGAQANED